MIRRVRPGSVLATVLLAGFVAGCTADGGLPTTAATSTASPFRDCAGLTPAGSAAIPAGSAATPAGSAATPAGPAQLPDLELPCFTGGQPVRLADLRGPAVINIWATWCAPCRGELPAMQRLADRAGGRLRVIGVDTGDAREAAASFGADMQVTLPMLDDPNRTLVGALGRTALPVTVFLDAAGKRFVYNQLPPDDAQLAALVRAHTGVAVTG